jgi:hypothetical protein
MREMLERLDRRAAGEVVAECPVTLTKRATLETVKAADRFVVPWLGPILRLWAWGLGRFGGRVMFALAFLLLAGVACALLTLALTATGAAFGAGLLLGMAS